jgi:CubicO group peptidase (beta-lactamase class C family)
MTETETRPGFFGSSTVRSRRLVRVALALLAVAVAIALTYGWRVAAILVAYKAKQVCSGLFVAGRGEQAVVTELEVDDLELLRLIDSSADPSRKSVTASAFGLITREAAYRGETGCALVLDRRSVRLPASAEGFGEARRSALRARRRQPDLEPGAGERAAISPPPALVFAHDDALTNVLDRAFAEASTDRLQRTRAVVIVHDGLVVGERYADGITADTPLIGWSMTKSVMNALAGILVRQGRWSLDAAVPIPEWRQPGDPRGAITLDDLLHMSSGLEFDEQMTLPLTDVLHMLLAVGDMAAFAADKPLEAAPGTRWQYSSGTSVILARAMRTAMRDGGEYEVFPRRALFEPLRMSSAVLETDAAGTFVGSSLMYATARDWARFGMLYLQDGVWNGQRILPAGWVEYTRMPAPADASRRYGAHFWLDVPDGYRASAAPLPADAFHAAGHQGQFVTIVPSRNVVIVRLGGTRHHDAWDQTAFVRDVLAALDRRNQPRSRGAAEGP